MNEEILKERKERRKKKERKGEIKKYEGRMKERKKE